MELWHSASSVLSQQNAPQVRKLDREAQIEPCHAKN